MIHPSDIAGLSEGLSVVSNQINRWIEWERGHRAKEHLSTDDDTHIMALPVPFWPTHGQFKAWIKLFSEAATALDSLSARVKELEAEQTLGWIETINNENDKNAAMWRARALRAEQQRDEAYERAAKVAELKAVEFLSPEYAANQPMGSFCERFACEQVAAAIRRLASGPEGGEKPQESKP